MTRKCFIYRTMSVELQIILFIVHIWYPCKRKQQSDKTENNFVQKSMRILTIWPHTFGFPWRCGLWRSRRYRCRNWDRNKFHLDIRSGSCPHTWKGWRGPKRSRYCNDTDWVLSRFRSNRVGRSGLRIWTDVHRRSILHCMSIVREQCRCQFHIHDCKWVRRAPSGFWCIPIYRNNDLGQCNLRFRIHFDRMGHTCSQWVTFYIPHCIDTALVQCKVRLDNRCCICGHKTSPRCPEHSLVYRHTFCPHNCHFHIQWGKLGHIFRTSLERSQDNMNKCLEQCKDHCGSLCRKMDRICENYADLECSQGSRSQSRSKMDGTENKFKLSN